MRNKFFYIEFQIVAADRFNTLDRFFTALKLEKDRIIKSWDSDDPCDEYDPAGEPQWLDFLDAGAIDWFANRFDYKGAEGKTYQALWNLTTPEIRRSHSMFVHHSGDWDFESMIDSIFNSEYVLVKLIKESETSGVLYYDPWAFPFGSSESLVELIKSFGHIITFDSYHKGVPYRYDVGWDYDLAKKLVSEGKGFVPE